MEKKPILEKLGSKKVRVNDYEDNNSIIFREFDFLELNKSSKQILMIGGEDKTKLFNSIIKNNYLTIENMNNKYYYVINDDLKKSKLKYKFEDFIFLQNVKIINEAEFSQLIIEKQHKPPHEMRNSHDIFMFHENVCDDNFINSEIFREIVQNGRHYHASTIFNLSNPQTIIKPELRCNFDIFFVSYDETKETKEYLWNHYFGMFPDFEGFEKVFNELTKNNNYMIYKYLHMGKIEDMLFYSKNIAKTKLIKV